MANQGKRMVQEDELKYLQTLKKEHEDPTAPWGGGGSDYTAGEGIDITENVISIDDETVALKTDIVTSYNDLTDKPTIPVMDDETLVLDTTTNKYKTAIGGYKEVVTYDFDPTLPWTGSDFHLIDSDLANAMFNTLETNVEYPVTLTFENTTLNYPIVSAYVKATSKTATRYGGASTLSITFDRGSTTSTVKWEFYVDISTNRINMWPSSSGYITTTTDSTLKIDFDMSADVAVYHKIDVNYLPDVLSLIPIGEGLSVTNHLGTIDGKLNVNINGSGGPISTNYSTQGDNRNVVMVNLKYNKSNFELESTPISNDQLKSVVGGGYKNDITINKSDLTFVSINKWNITNTDLINEIIDFAIKVTGNLTYTTIESSGEWLNSSGERLNSMSTQTYAIYATPDTTTGYVRYYSSIGSFYSTQIHWDFIYDPVNETVVSQETFYVDSSYFNNANFDKFIATFGLIGTSGGTIIRQISSRWGKVEQIDKKFIPLVSEIPAVDTTIDGNYVLKATVSSGVVTYSWELQS